MNDIITLCVLQQCLSDLCGEDGTLNKLKTRLDRFNLTAQTCKHTHTNQNKTLFIHVICNVVKILDMRCVCFIAMICPPGPPGIPGPPGRYGEFTRTFKNSLFHSFIVAVQSVFIH